MRKRFLLTLIVSTFMLWACDGKDSTDNDNVDIENENETADVNASVDSGEESSQEDVSQTASKNEENDTVTGYALYEKLIEEIRKGIENPDDFFSQNDYSYPLYCAMTSENSNLGYLQKDIDGDGTDELLIARGDSEGNVPEGDLLYMYTIQEGSLEIVAEETEREWCQLCENGIIKYKYSYPSIGYGTDYYKYENGNLELIESMYSEAVIEEHRNRYCYADKDTKEDAARELTKEEHDKIWEELELRYKTQTFRINLLKG